LHLVVVVLRSRPSPRPSPRDTGERGKMHADKKFGWGLGIPGGVIVFWAWESRGSPEVTTPEGAIGYWGSKAGSVLAARDWM
jgi:hypothetical protein